MHMILAALRERAEAESRKCCAMLTRRDNQTNSLLPGSAQKYNPNLTGGGCYITPDLLPKRDQQLTGGRDNGHLLETTTVFVAHGLSTIR